MLHLRIHGEGNESSPFGDVKKDIHPNCYLVLDAIFTNCSPKIIHWKFYWKLYESSIRGCGKYIHPILYINSVSLLVCSGWYILNLCEQGVVFVFNMLFWTCLFMWTKIGQCQEDSSNHYPFHVEHLIMIFIFFVEGRGGGGGVLGVLIAGSEKEHIIILC